ncbi:MAG: acyl-CoA dehydrogenase family protein [Pseudomonadota bacterium]
MTMFDDLDFLNFDELLSDEERMVRDTVREFVKDQVLPAINQHARAGTFPRELIKPMAGIGLFGANIKGYECAGMNEVAYGLAVQELEHGDSGLRSFVSVQSALCMYPIHHFGSEQQKDKWLPKMARGEVIGCFGLTEPDFGSDPGGMITRAEKKGSKWVLHGTKYWITNATIADLAVIWAKTPDGVRGFLVEKGTPGFTANEIKGKMSLRASDTGELCFDRCEIPEENLLPKTKNLGSALSCLNQARYGIAWGTIGAAQACFGEALDYAKKRPQFGKPIAGFQLVQDKLTWMATEITKGQLLILRVGRLKDEGKVKPHQVSMAKRNNVAIALECARKSRDILGANGILDDYCSMRHMVNLESVYTYEGTHDIHSLIIAEHLTGLPAYR